MNFGAIAQNLRRLHLGACRTICGHARSTSHPPAARPPLPVPRVLIPLVLVPLVLVTVGGCGASTSTIGIVSGGGPVGVCQYLTQSDAQAMLGAPTGPGKLEHVAGTDGTCAYVPRPATVTGARVALTVSTSDVVGQTLEDFKKEHGDATPVDGLGFTAMRSADGRVFASQHDKRACTLILSVKSRPTRTPSPSRWAPCARRPWVCDIGDRP